MLNAESGPGGVSRGLGVTLSATISDHTHVSLLAHACTMLVMYFSCVSSLVNTYRIMPQVLILLILAQVWLSRSQFVFELEVDLDSVMASDFSCEIGLTDNDPRCQIYFPIFCLREPEGITLQSIQGGYCPLGRNTSRMNTYLENQPNTRRITSDSPWPVRDSYINNNSIG